MDNTFMNIFQSIKSCHDLEQEFSKPFGWIRFKEKREYKKLKDMVKEKINSLYDDEWTVEYIRSMQIWIKAHYIQLREFIGNEVYISEYEPDNEKNDPNTFTTMYFVDQKHKNRIIGLDIVSDNITFNIADLNIGSTFSVESIGKVQPSQKKIESVCKNCIVLMLLRYLD